VNSFQHLDHLDVGTPVQRSPQRTDSGRAGGEQIGFRRADRADRRGAAVLFVVGVQDEDQVQGVLDLRSHDVLLVGNGKHHVQKVGAVTHLRVGVDERQAARPAVGKRRDRADLANQPCGGRRQGFRVLQGEESLMVTRQVAQCRRQNRHRRSVDGNVIEVVLQAFVQQLVLRQLFAEGL